MQPCQSQVQVSDAYSVQHNWQKNRSSSVPCQYVQSEIWWFIDELYMRPYVHVISFYNIQNAHVIMPHISICWHYLMMKKKGDNITVKTMTTFFFYLFQFLITNSIQLILSRMKCATGWSRRTRTFRRLKTMHFAHCF